MNQLNSTKEMIQSLTWLKFNKNEVIEVLFNTAKNDQGNRMLQASAYEVLTEILIRNLNMDFKKQLNL